jgi:hypothetical protein
LVDDYKVDGCRIRAEDWQAVRETLMLAVIHIMLLNKLKQTGSWDIIV